MPINLTNPFVLRIAAAVSVIFLTPGAANAWGYEGHARVGRLALSAVDETAAGRIQEILGPDVVNAADEACNWPDVVRETPDWEWSAPQHYVNIPRATAEYERARDCPQGLCVTEAIKKYADQLGNPRLDSDQRWQAFAWLCHLVGDLHQPLHAGYKDDRGGNSVKISYQGVNTDLHQFWDRILIQDRMKSGIEWNSLLSGHDVEFAGQDWNPDETDAWTNESHLLVKTVAYPPELVIRKAFAEQSWLVILDQLNKAGSRLAQILNATIGDGNIKFNRVTYPEQADGQ